MTVPVTCICRNPACANHLIESIVCTNQGMRNELNVSENCVNNMTSGDKIWNYEIVRSWQANEESSSAKPAVAGALILFAQKRDTICRIRRQWHLWGFST